ncbi:hypothetical protein [Streptomyces sp. DH37]|uniref:hypothetical protein n=1 Tax=Streptomyces sp. DH37 TaxID=3040122 RepID=UPI002441C983|nr:hypothetical protein [Streptomyces sp. DH37]MDG9701426.1 hypothetical protein [Streptomyces sp. DH37]
MSDKADKTGRAGGRDEHDTHRRDTGRGERVSAADLIPGEEPEQPATPPRVPPAGPFGGTRPRSRSGTDEDAHEAGGAEDSGEGR